MMYAKVTLVLALAAGAIAAPSGEVQKRAQTVYLAGDSTMARGSSPIMGPSASTLLSYHANIDQGWGEYLHYSLSLPVVNKAIGGRSSRSYTREGRFDEIVNLVKANDIVVIEFGHNDGGSLSSSDNGRSVCGGAGDETCQTTYNGVKETVHTFPWYLKEAGKKIIAKGGKVIVSSQTPNNPWEGGTFQYSDSRFITYAKDVAASLGSNAFYVDHGRYTANYYQSIGKAATDKLFPQDHTHTSPAGADVVHKTFVKGVQCGGGGFLKGFVKNVTASIPGSCV